MAITMTMDETFEFVSTSGSSGRHGKLKASKREINTPCAVFSTSRGHPSLITPDKLNLNPLQPNAFLLRLSDVALFLPLFLFGKSFRFWF
jgi:hypothetical protein